MSFWQNHVSSQMLHVYSTSLYIDSINISFWLLPHFICACTLFSMIKTFVDKPNPYKLEMFFSSTMINICLTVKYIALKEDNIVSFLLTHHPLVQPVIPHTTHHVWVILSDQPPNTHSVWQGEQQGTWTLSVIFCCRTETDPLSPSWSPNKLVLVCFGAHYPSLSS